MQTTGQMHVFVQNPVVFVENESIYRLDKPEITGQSLIFVQKTRSLSGNWHFRGLQMSVNYGTKVRNCQISRSLHKNNVISLNRRSCGKIPGALWGRKRARRCGVGSAPARCQRSVSMRRGETVQWTVSSDCWLARARTKMQFLCKRREAT